MQRLSIVLPAKNEATSLRSLLPRLQAACPDAEIIVVDDGSEDDTCRVVRDQGATCVSHPYSIGNGGAIKTGARAARGEIVIFMDADGQHAPEDVPALVAEVEAGYDMCVGARNTAGQSSTGRLAANWIYNRLASWMVGQRVEDLTSGFRAAKRQKFLQFLHLLPNGFSYPTTITMAFFRAAYSVKYLELNIRPNEGRSHVSPLKDGLRFLLIITRVATLYSPLKLFFPLSFVSISAGIGLYIHNYLTVGQFTNMSALLLMTGTLIFLIGLVSEQITTVIYQLASRDLADRSARDLRDD